MRNETLQDVLVRFQRSFRAWFPALTDEDMRAILDEPRQKLLSVLGERYGYTAAEAKSAWNEFVLRHVDGNGVQRSRPGHGGGFLECHSMPPRSKIGWPGPQLPIIQPPSFLLHRPWLRQLPRM